MFHEHKLEKCLLESDWCINLWEEEERRDTCLWKVKSSGEIYNRLGPPEKKYVFPLLL